ncbi:MAG: YihY/virulence factor BrkB family protein [Alphaproteobacteria bacterium]|nr:MAG: YihY/virulence factor BrkB family protein [Alphaproteobacteria bacterium]
MSWEYIENLVTRTIKEWLEDDSITYSAALAFYFVLSLPALLLFSVSIGSFFLKSENIQYTILNHLQGVVDESIITMITVLFEHIPDINSLSIGALFGFLLLLWSASNIFRQLKNFLERAWNIEHVESSNVKDFIRDAIVSSIIVIFFGGLLVVSIIIESIVYLGSSFLQGLLPFSPVIADYASPMASFFILVLFFMLAYKILPDSSLDLKSIFVGSLVTVILITIGKYAVGLFLAYSNPVSIYGALGSIIGLFLLIFYSSIMITIGVEFTKVYSES